MANAKPIIGITTYLTLARFGVWEDDAALIPAAYVRAVEAAGGRALLVPPSMEGIDETLDALDGLLFSGGSDLDPELYDQQAHAETDEIVEQRELEDVHLVLAHGDDRLADVLAGRGQITPARQEPRPGPLPGGHRRRYRAVAHLVGPLEGGRRLGALAPQ